jgi:hypothetical protein
VKANVTGLIPFFVFIDEYLRIEIIGYLLTLND